MKKIGIIAAGFILAVTWLNCGGSSSSDSSSASGTLTITGQVTIDSADLNLASPISQSLSKGVSTAKTAGDTALASATVSLYKQLADGTEEDTGITATTDANGNYTLENVPTAVTGTGAATDFYLEARVTSGSLVVKAPMAPTADQAVNINPGTHLAADALLNVANIPGVSAPNVLPSEMIIENLRDMFADDVTDKSAVFSVPSMASDNSANVTIAAAALASDNGEADKIIGAYEYEMEELYHTQNADADAAAPYIERVIKSGCGYESNFYVPRPVINALGEAFVAGTTFTPAEIIAANNTASDADADSTTSISEFNTLLANVETSLANKTDISSSDLVPMYVKRALSSAMASDTPLEADQMMAFVQTLGTTNCANTNLDYVLFANELLGTNVLSSSGIADMDLYYVYSGTCDINQNQVRLNGRVAVYSPSATVNSVTISGVGSDLTISTQSGENIFAIPDGDAHCLTIGTTYNLTVTASLSDSTTVSDTKTITPVALNAAQISSPDRMDGDTAGAFPNQFDDPVHVTAQRPIFGWTPQPGTANVPAGAPSGSKIAFLYDISHFLITSADYEDSHEGGPDNRCDMSSNGNRPFKRNYFLTPIDCDAVACDDLTGLPHGSHVCRLWVQTVLFDEYDRTYGWSAGGAAYFCIHGQEGCE